MSRKEDKSPLRIALAGLGTVGTGTLQLLKAQDAILAQRCGRPLQVVAVADLDCKRDRGVDMAGIACYDDALKMIAEVDADVVVELIGGSDGIAKAVCEAALDPSAVRHAESESEGANIRGYLRSKTLRRRSCPIDKYARSLSGIRELELRRLW
ncbi:MAG: hypothetical protein HOI33_04180, partial [Rhodospirillaceae bacterium]|nr:hypothetical protein [Rhodospirillaceae bacterium]